MIYKDEEKIFKEEQDQGDELIFYTEEEEETTVDSHEEIMMKGELELETGGTWKLLVVDDEEDIHTVTHLTLDDFTFEGKPVEILDAYSADEAYGMIAEHPDIAITLLDVVMETNTAGLELVHRIRRELENHFIRIILRTGQPGYAPEREVVLNYDINDYKSKTELTSDKIFTLVTSGLRAYRSLLSLESYRRDLQKKVDAAVLSIREKDHIIIRQSRQNAISELITNISHQWRQPLNTVMALIQDIEYNGQQEELTIDYLQEQSEQAMSIIQEMSETIDDLRYFFQPVEEEVLFSIKEIVDRCHKLLEPVLREEDILLNINCEDDIQITGYRNDYAQVLLQIIKNSRESLLENNIRQKKQIEIIISEKEGRSQVVVRDNGMGISEEAFEHIFEPYYTTKFQSPGKGLSLYMCKIVIEKNMCGLLRSRNLAEGAEFIIEV